ncbi:MAG TPA: hypothetical protein VIZ28_08410 [Chitinophagaceae bacterium]
MTLEPGAKCNELSGSITNGVQEDLTASKMPMLRYNLSTTTCSFIILYRKDHYGQQGKRSENSLLSLVSHHRYMKYLPAQNLYEIFFTLHFDK